MPERFETFDQAMGRANGVALVEAIRTEILVGGGPLGGVEVPPWFAGEATNSSQVVKHPYLPNGPR